MSEDSTEDAEKLWAELDTVDVGQKRYLMNHIFERMIRELYEMKSLELPEPSERITKLEEKEGYIYKLSQEFLTSGSTLEKEEKLEKIREYIERKN